MNAKKPTAADRAAWTKIKKEGLDEILSLLNEVAYDRLQALLERIPINLKALAISEVSTHLEAIVVDLDEMYEKFPDPGYSPLEFRRPL